MRKMFLIAAASIGLFLGRAGAEAITVGDEAVGPAPTLGGQLLTANLMTPAVAGGLALAVDDGGDAAATKPASVEWTL